MFTIYRSSESDATKTHINEYNLSRPFDVSSKIYAGDDERCIITKVGDNGPEAGQGKYDLEFSSDGKSFFFVSSANGTNANGIFKYNLTSPYDVSSCEFGEQNKNLGSTADPNLQNGSNAGDMPGDIQKNRPQGLEINDDGTKIFVIYHGDRNLGGTPRNTRVLEYDLSTPYSLSTMSLVTDAGIELEDECANPMGIRFSNDGKRLWCVEHMNAASDVVQISLDVAYSTSSFTIDGEVRIVNLGGNGNLSQPRGIAFSQNGLKMYVGSDRTVNGGDEVVEFNLSCPFNIIAGKCPSITENSDRTGMALAQIEIAKRTIAHSTDTALNRLKWIRRNKDLQDLSYQNIKLNFSNQMLASLSEAIQISTKEKEKDDDIFYWAEGSLAFGKVKETDTSSKKKIYTDGITIGADKFTVGDGIKGLAFRFSQNDVKVGTVGSKLDANTYNLTYYSTAPVKDDRRFLDTIIGIGSLRYNISSVLDGSKLNGNRNGRQIYGTLKIKEEIKKDDHTLIPAAQIDLGYTLLSSYSESGTSSMKFDKQSIQSRNLRLSLASVEELNNKKYKMKRHGKIEYQANLHRSSNIKYSYIGDSASGKFDTELNSGALHNINGELGIDVIFDDNFSLFFIVEHNYKHRVGYTNKIHIAIGYLPQKNTNFAFKIEGDDILKSKYIYTKNVNGLDIDFYLLNNNAMRPETFDEIAFNLRKVF